MIASLQILRLVMALLQTLALLAGYRYLDVLQQQWLPLWMILSWMVLFATQFFSPRFQTEEQTLLIHLVVDCLLLTAMLYLAGGATNPFVSYYLVPIAVSAATLSIRSTALLTTACLLAYSGLMFYFQPLQVLSPHDMHAGHLMLHSDQDQIQMMPVEQPNWHVMGMWLNFGLSALLITWFVTRMASTLRSQQAELAAIREQRLRDDQLLGVATLAAGTVHELATPLSTMAILTEDLKLAAQQDKNLYGDMLVLAEQVERCKTIVQNLSRTAAQQQSGILRRVGIQNYFRDVLTHWQLLQPGVPVKIYNEVPQGFICTDATLEQALINLLNNAAEASPHGIEVVVTRPVSGEIHFTIRDFGAGIELSTDQLGKPFVSTRGEGRGLGLFLSRAAIERLRGQVRLEPHPDGGTVTMVILAVES